MTLEPQEHAAARRKQRRDEALTQLRRAGTWGAGLYVLGVLLVVISPKAADTGDGSGSGDTFLAVLGVMSGSVGAALVLVFLIGWGVKLGREAADV